MPRGCESLEVEDEMEVRVYRAATRVIMKEEDSFIDRLYRWRSVCSIPGVPLCSKRHEDVKCSVLLKCSEGNLGKSSSLK